MTTLTKEVTVPAQARKMPVKTVEIKLDEIGYEGWWAKMRTNPRAELYDKFLSDNDDESWDAFGELIMDWNFVDDEGKDLAKPHHEDGTKRGDLPYEVQAYVISRYVYAFNQSAKLPKMPGTDLDSSSTTNDSGPVEEKA